MNSQLTDVKLASRNLVPERENIAQVHVPRKRTGSTIQGGGRLSQSLGRPMVEKSPHVKDGPVSRTAQLTSCDSFETVRDERQRQQLCSIGSNRAPCRLATEIDNINQTIAHRKQMLGHVDATLKLLNPSIETHKIPNKRVVKLFRPGELGRLILDTMRRIGETVAVSSINTAILDAGGHGEEARRVV